MSNNTYDPENDLNLEKSLLDEDIYIPENDLTLNQSLISVPQLGVLKASANTEGGVTTLLTGNFRVTGATSAGTGETLTVSGTTSLATTEAVSNASGKTVGLDLAVTETLEVLTANASSIGGQSSLQGTGLGTIGATSTVTGGSGLSLVIPPIGTTSAQANATGGETGFDVLGTGGAVSVIIDGEKIETFTNIEIQKRLNEIDTFAFSAFITDSADRALINEGATVKILEDYSTLLFKGRLTEVEYKSSFRAKCEGDGMVTKLLNRKTDRETFTKRAGDDIVKSVVDSSVITYGDIESAPQVSVRFDHDNLARAVAGVANATGFDWYIDQRPSDNWEIDYLNFVEDAGASTTQQILEIGSDAEMVERNKDEGFVANDITLLGRGDGINQLEARVFAASNQYTDTTTVVDENELTSFTVADTTELGSIGDNIIIRAGTEVMDVNISDSTTLSINSRGLNDYEGNSTDQIRHYDGIRVWRMENITQGVGRFSPENPEPGSSIDSNNIKEQRETDKTIVDISTLEKAADLDLKNRFEDVFRVKVGLTDPRDTQNLSLGDQVEVKDLTAMNVDDAFNIVGMDIKRSSAEEGTVLHLSNRPRRLTERLSELESDRDTLNAHMQGATNINGEHFEDNCDNAHPLNNKVYVPDDVVEINKFDVVFARESFRGYTESTQEESGHTHQIDQVPQHTHNIDQIPDHDHNFRFSIPEHTHDYDIPAHTHGIDDLPTHQHQMLVSTGTTTDKSINREFAYYDIDNNIGASNIYVAGDASEDIYTSEAVSSVETGVETQASAQILDQSSKGGGSYTADTTTGTINTIDTTESTGNNNASTTVESTQTGSAHSHGVNYGIFEPVSEPDVDIEVRVDGNLVTTINNVSVGEEYTKPIDLISQLSDPLTGTYHEVTLTPVDTGGGENGRCKLAADINQKVFIESTL